MKDCGSSSVWTRRMTPLLSVNSLPIPTRTGTNSFWPGRNRKRRSMRHRRENSHRKRNNNTLSPMMTDAPTGHFQSIVLQPHAGQFVIDELPAIVLCCAAWVYGGMEGLPLTALAVSVAALLSLALLYRFIYLRRTRYHIGSEQLISRHGVLSRKTDYMEQYRIVDFVEHQSLMQQLCGLKTVRIFSMDRNTPPA